MNDAGKSNNVSLGMVILIASIALNGLMAGYIIAKTSTPNPVLVERSGNPQSGTQNVGDARRIVGHLPAKRRRELLETAFKNLNVSAEERPRALFQNRQMARRKAMHLALSDPLDDVAMTKALEDVRQINNRLAIQGDALVIEVLQLMTPEERKQTAQTSVQGRRDERQRRRRQRD